DNRLGRTPHARYRPALPHRSHVLHAPRGHVHARVRNRRPARGPHIRRGEWEPGRGARDEGLRARSGRISNPSAAGGNTVPGIRACAMPEISQEWISELKKGSVQLCLLALLAREQKYGFQI